MGVNKIIPVEGSQPEKTNGMKTEPRGNKQTQSWGAGATRGRQRVRNGRAIGHVRCAVSKDGEASVTFCTSGAGVSPDKSLTSKEGPDIRMWINRRE